MITVQAAEVLQVDDDLLDFVQAVDTVFQQSFNLVHDRVFIETIHQRRCYGELLCNLCFRGVARAHEYDQRRHFINQLSYQTGKLAFDRFEAAAHIRKGSVYLVRDTGHHLAQ